jgi:hypothetical protein
VDRFVATGAEDCRAENPLRGRMDRDPDETLRLALVHRPADARHRPRAGARANARAPDLAVGHADARERVSARPGQCR